MHRKAKNKTFKQSMFKSIVAKSFGSDMVRDEQLMVIYAYIESLVNPNPNIIKKPIKRRLLKIVGFFVSKLLDFIVASEGRFTSIEHQTVTDMQSYLIKGGSVQAFFEEQSSNIRLWYDLLCRVDVINHFYSDLSESDLDSLSSPSSSPEQTSSPEPEISGPTPEPFIPDGSSSEPATDCG